MKESFVSQEENDKLVKEIFIILGYCSITLVIVLLLLWGYNTSDNNKFLFIMIYSTIIILYCIVVISLIVMDKKNYDITSYFIIFGSTIFTIFMAFFIAMFSVYKYLNIPSINLQSSEKIIDYTYK